MNVITGTEGADNLTGSASDDLIDGGAGIDVLAGGLGNDTYYVDGYAKEVDPGEGKPQQDHDRDGRAIEDGNRNRNEEHDQSHGLFGKKRWQSWKRLAAFFKGTDEAGHRDRQRDELAIHSFGKEGHRLENIRKRLSAGDRRIALHASDRGIGDRHVDDGFRPGDIHHNSDVDHDIPWRPAAEEKEESADKDTTNYITDTVIENADNGHDTVFSSITYSLTENVEDLYLTGVEDLDGSGNNLDNWIFGNAGDNRLSGGLGADILQGGAGDDSYLFNIGDGDDTVINGDAAGVDRILLGAGVDAAGVALLRSGDDLEVGYGATDRVTVGDFFAAPDTRIDELQLADDTSLTAADINTIVQQMSAYAVQEGIALNSLDQVKQDQDLMNLVVGSWHAA